MDQCGHHSSQLYTNTFTFELMITIKNLHKKFNDNHVLKGIDYVFEAGKTNLIIGQSGSGKTVLLKSLLGIYEPTEGTISFDGKIYGDLSAAEKRELRSKIGMVFQGNALFDSMTVAENIGFPLKMFTKMSESEIKERVNFVMNHVKLSDAKDRLPAEISGGMQKRVAIGRAIVNNPKYLFCDEPNSGLDPRTSIVIDNLLQDITREFKITTVINTHDMNSVMEIGDKILFLKDGLKAWTGNKDQVFKTDNEAVVDFVYSSNLFKKVREAVNRGY